MKFAKRLIVIATVLAAAVASAQSAKSNAVVQAEAKKLAAWGHDPVLVAAVKQQNAKKVSLAKIQEIDKQWLENKDAISAVLLANACSQHLKALVAKNPAYSESFVMDDQGANVCLTDRTSDYWQGDEAKWQKSFNGGNGTVFIDERKYDSSADAVLVQIGRASCRGRE